MFMKQEPDLETARTALKEKLPRFLDYFEAELPEYGGNVGNCVRLCGFFFGGRFSGSAMH